MNNIGGTILIFVINMIIILGIIYVIHLLRKYFKK